MFFLREFNWSFLCFKLGDIKQRKRIKMSRFESVEWKENKGKISIVKIPQKIANRISLWLSYVMIVTCFIKTIYVDISII